MILAMIIVGTSAMAAAGILLPKEYEATATVQVNSILKNTLTGRIETNVRVSEFLGQQAALAQSRTVALVVFDQLLSEGYISMDDFRERWREETGGETIAGNDARLWAADQLLARLNVSGDALASSLIIRFASHDPGQAAKIANAFANGYMLTVLDQKQRRSARNAEKFSAETQILARDVETARQRLSEYRTQSGIVGLGLQRLESAEVELSTLTNRLGDARADFSEAQSLLRQAQRLDGDGLLNLPLTSENLPGRQAQLRLGSVLIQLNRLRERYDDQYPDMIELMREKSNLQTNIMQSIENRFSYAQKRVEELESAVSRQKEKVLVLQESKQTFEDLEKAVESSRDTYDLVAARSLQESLQSRIDVVDVVLLSRAIPANQPTMPALPVLMLMGSFIGGIIGCMMATLLEVVENRVRTRKTVQTILNVPVLAELPIAEAPTSQKPHKKKKTTGNGSLTRRGLAA